MALSQPRLDLAPTHPPQRLVTRAVLLPALTVCVLMLAWQGVSLGVLTMQGWYTRFDPQQQGGGCFAVQEKTTACTAVWYLVVCNGYMVDVAPRYIPCVCSSTNATLPF